MAQRVESSVVIAAPVQQVYDYWKTLENLPGFMSNVEDITATGSGRTYWRIKGPLGVKVEFEADTTRNEENEEISWSTVGGDVESSGTGTVPRPRRGSQPDRGDHGLRGHARRPGR